jgi:hypothetical protein
VFKLTKTKTASIKRASISRKLTKAGKTKGRVHVIPQQGKWAVRKEGAKRAVAVVSDKVTAVSRAKELVKSGGTTVAIVHNKDGTISSSYSSKKVTEKKTTGKKTSASKSI